MRPTKVFTGSSMLLTLDKWNYAKMHAIDSMKGKALDLRFLV